MVQLNSWENLLKFTTWLDDYDDGDGDDVVVDDVDDINGQSYPSKSVLMYINRRLYI